MIGPGHAGLDEETTPIRVGEVGAPFSSDIPTALLWAGMNQLRSSCGELTGDYWICLEKIRNINKLEREKLSHTRKSL